MYLVMTPENCSVVDKGVDLLFPDIDVDTEGWEGMTLLSRSSLELGEGDRGHRKEINKTETVESEEPRETMDWRRPTEQGG